MPRRLPDEGGGLQAGGVPLSRAPARLAAALVVGFVALLAALHVVEPEFDPAHHMISEYALGRLGWLMTAAFVSLGGAALALGEALRAHLGRGSAGLRVIGAALVGAALFPTDPLIEGLQHGTVHALHKVCGTVVIFGFPGVATALALRLRRREAWAHARGELGATTAAVWLGLVGFVASLVALGPPPAGAVGWPNRGMMLAYCAWLFAAARRAGRAVTPA